MLFQLVNLDFLLQQLEFRSAMRAFITPLPLSEPRRLWMQARVMGRRTMPAAVEVMTALVPVPMWNCFRNPAGMTTRPLVVKRTEPVLVVLLTPNYLTADQKSVKA